MKVLDFGLAKCFADDVASIDAANSPTALAGTAAGLILGTAAYMSPEQARGAAVDKRTDIWALGCILYEMLTGRPAFGSDNLSDTLAAVLRGEPDWRALPDRTPPPIRLLLQRCLRKDPRQRVHDAADVRIELDDVEGGAASIANERSPSSARWVASIAMALLAGAAIASAAWWVATRRSDKAAPIHLSLTSPSLTSSALLLNANHQVAISPDGRTIVYVSHAVGKRQLYLRSIGESEGHPIEGTEEARTAFFSPDGRWIAFGNAGELQKVAVSGGSPIPICKLSSTGFYGGDWGRDDTIVFVPDYDAGLWSVSAQAGTPRPLLQTDPEHDRKLYVDPKILPGRQGHPVDDGLAPSSPTIRTLPSSAPGAHEPEVLVRGGSNARYLPTGQIVYVRAGALLSVDSIWRP